MKLFRNMTLLTLLLLIAAPLSAADDAEKKAKGKKGKGNANAGIFAAVSKIELTGEQKEKLAALKKEFAPKLAEIRKNSGITPELRKARTAAFQEAKDKGLKGKERAAFLAEKAPQTEAQKKAQAALKELNEKIKGKINEFLTDAQKAKLGAKKGDAGGKKPEAAEKKKKAKKDADK